MRNDFICFDCWLDIHHCLARDVALYDLLRKKGFRRQIMLRLFQTQCAVGASARCRFSRSYRIPAHQPARARHFCRPNVAIRAMSIVSSHEQRSGVTLCVEGNISAGKSTFLSDIIEGSKILKVRFPHRPVAVSSSALTVNSIFFSLQNKI